jgi:uncharacterized protein (DUF2141 family)
MSRFSRTISALSIGLVAIGCGEPPVVDAQDKYVCPSDGGPCVLVAQPGVVSGSLVYQGARRGDAVLLLFSSTALPPPDGTASAPVEIGRIASATLFAGASPGSTGPFSAPFLFTEVPPGNYQIRAFLDLGGDFSPFADFTQSPHAGAPTGGTVTFDANGSATLTNFNVGPNARVLEQVVIGQEVPFDPPSFQLAAGQTTAFPQNIDRPQVLTLTVFNPGVPHANFSKPKFTLQLRPNAAGAAQESDADGLLDVYPQVTLLQTSAVQADGTSVPVSGTEAAIVPCKVLPISTWPLLISQPGGQFGLDQVTVLIEPIAVKITASGATLPQATIPAGQYKLVVAERTGQIWTLPNSLGSQASTSGFYVASQATTISFTSAVAAGGAISGKINFPPGSKPHNLIVQAFAGGPSLAPPLSVQVPVRVFSIPGRFLPVDGSGNIQAVPYALTGLTPGTYAVEALDDADGNFNNIDILQTPTRGDLVGGAFDNLGHLASIVVGSIAVSADITMVGAPGQDGQGHGTPLDPPAFVYAAGGAMKIAQDAKSTVRINVQAQPDVFPALNQSAATTVFTVALVRDSVGNVVDSDGDGLPDVWPRAFLLEIDPADPQGLALKTPLTALPAAVDPTPFLPALLAGSVSTVLPATHLSIIVRPTAVDLTNPAAPSRLSLMPAAKYKLILMNETGQLWQVPNSSGSAALDPRAAALVNTSSQSQAFAVVPPAAAVNAGEIDGTVQLSGVPSFKSVYVFAYSVSDPPPPFGAGKPRSVDFHGAAEFSSAGTVSYALRGLAAGDYYVTAVCDTRGDFAVDPFFFAAAPGPGDFVGGHVDTTTFSLSKVTVAGVVPGISVFIAGGETRKLPARPSFDLESGAMALTMDLTALFPDAVSPQRITLQAQTVLTSGVVAIAPEAGPAFFPVTYQACSATDATRGADSDFDNLPDLYPRILVVKLSDADSSGLTIDSSNTVIPAAIDPTPYLAALGACSTHAVVPATRLSVILQPIAVQQTPTGLLQKPIPAGRYGVFLESETGQVWRIPNELQPALLDPRSAATTAGQLLATQGVAIRVASQVPAARSGGITGTVSLVHQSAIGNVVIAAYAATAPPPPLGTGRPLAVQLIPSALVAAAGSSPIPYLIANLAPGPYLLLALHDPLDEFSPSLDYLSTPPQGAQISFAGGASPSVIQVGNTVASAPAITLDGTSPAETIPFPRPAFSLMGSPLAVSSSAAPGTAAVIELVPDDPSGVPFALPATPAFHPTPARDSSGQPYRDPATTCGTTSHPYVSSAVYASPIDTGSNLVAYVAVNACQFCQSLTGSADCSAALLPIPQPMTTPIAVGVTNIAVNPATKMPAGVALPPGHYAITLIEQTGQSWTVPNALATADTTQAAVFTVTP